MLRYGWAEEEGGGLEPSSSAGPHSHLMLLQTMTPSMHPHLEVTILATSGNIENTLKIQL